MFLFLQKFLAKRQLEAIEILNKQYVLDQDGETTIERHEFESWQRLTGEIIKRYMGHESKFYIDFVGMDLFSVNKTDKPYAKDYNLETEKMVQANVILKDCIIYIATFKYLFRKPSLFGLLPIAQQIALGIFGAGLFFSIGYYMIVNKPTFEKELIECKQNLERLQHELGEQK